MTRFKRTLTAILCTLLLITLVQPAVFATDTSELLPFVITSSQGEITTDLTTATITLSYPADTQTDLLYINNLLSYGGNQNTLTNNFNNYGNNLDSLSDISRFILTEKEEMDTIK